MDIIVDFSQNNINNKKLEVHLLIYYLNLRNTKRIITSNKYNMDLIISIIKRILNSAYVSEKHKSIIKDIVKQRKFINFV